MKKRLFIVMIFLTVLVFCTGCIPSGERPYYFPNTKWSSMSPDIWFDIEDGKRDDTYGYIYTGEIAIGDRIEKIIVNFHHYTENVSFDEASSYDDDGDEIITFFKGKCKFHPEKLVVKIDKKTDTIFNGQYDTITFIREDLPLDELE